MLTIQSSIRGMGNMSILVTEFTLRLSVHMRNIRSGFGTRIQGELHSLWLGSIKSLSSKYLTSSLRYCCFTGFILYGCCFTGFEATSILGSWMTTYLGKSCSFCLPRVPFVNCRQFMYLVISLLVLRVGYGIWLYQFLIIAYLFTLNHQ